MSITKKVIVDTLGGDHAPQAQVQGAIAALEQNKDLQLVLVGDEGYIAPIVKSLVKDLASRVEIIHTTENIGCNEQPTVAIRQKPNSTIVLGQTALKTREDCGAFVSAGSTGAILTGAFMKVGRIEGVSRPALSPMLPTKDGRGVMVLDVGANMDCKAVNLVHFALMANEYMKAQGRDNPRIGLLSVGTEDEKGNELSLETFAILKKCDGINFMGNVEAREVYSGDYDIIVCDGFVGNVLLKTLEGTGKLFSFKLRQSMGGFVGLLGKLLLGRRLLRMKRELSEDGTGGAIFIGIKKPIVKAHGSSNATAFCNAILYAAKAGQMDLGEKISAVISEFNAKNAL